MEQILKITGFIIDSFVHIWPYLLITIPIAVIVQFSGAARYINKAFIKNPVVSILLATIVGAFSPFCSCGVIPVIASLLIGGVPLAPVMSFWIASPSMDPEIFFLSIASIGWEMSVWRLAATFVISLSAGYITHFLLQKGLLEKEILLKNQIYDPEKPGKSARLKIAEIINFFLALYKSSKVVSVQLTGVSNTTNRTKVNCCISAEELSLDLQSLQKKDKEPCNSCESINTKPESSLKKLSIELWKATAMVVRFMALAFFINALIYFYVPQVFISNLIGGAGPFSVIIATLVGIPAYTSNLTALPLISGLLSLGMDKGAALSFLIAGPTTTLPAMLAVWGIVKRKIFFLYLSFAIIGALLTGLLFNIVH